MISKLNLYHIYKKGLKYLNYNAYIKLIPHWSFVLQKIIQALSPPFCNVTSFPHSQNQSPLKISELLRSGKIRHPIQLPLLWADPECLVRKGGRGQTKEIWILQGERGLDPDPPPPATCMCPFKSDVFFIFFVCFTPPQSANTGMQHRF